MKIKNYTIVYLISAIIIAISSIFVIKMQMRLPDAIADINLDDITTTSYQDIHQNAIILDTFIDLNKKSYGELIDINVQNNQLEVTLKSTNQLGTDYYNNNKNLLELKLLEHGFEIFNDEKNNIIIAKFLIHKGNFVNVPNDVIMSLMYKAYNK